MIYFDGTHLSTDTDLDELHRFAERLGLRRSWFQDHRVPHYDVFGSAKERLHNAATMIAYVCGVDFQLVSPRELALACARKPGGPHA